ncbi:hypothetical protein HK099_004576 [Clydaea vesicula]|uniref:Uncharacterized protein n=1 Tax=Clydaea vesicula TaxID=447962 RepID=A0AAD5XVJ2_9FUNG|nr:hypothetical protein HK099_004576 [Clydaea vesicula]
MSVSRLNLSNKVDEIPIKVFRNRSSRAKVSNAYTFKHNISDMNEVAVTRIQQCKQLYESYKRQIELQDMNLSSCVENFRFSTWSTCGKMTIEEKEIHTSISAAFMNIANEDIYILNSRLELVLGRWKYGDKLMLDVGLTEPAISTATLNAEDISSEMVANALKQINTTSSSSSGSNSVKLTYQNGKPILVGKYSFAVVQIIRDNFYKLPKRRINFIGISSSSINSTILYKGNVIICTPTYKTLMLLRRVSSKMCVSELYNGTLRLSLKMGIETEGTYLRIDSCGVIGANGKASIIPKLFTLLRDILLCVMNDERLLSSYILSLQICS